MNNNTKAVVKLKHPNVNKEINDKTNAFASLAYAVSFVLPELSVFNFKGLINSLKLQLDYNNECKNQRYLKSMLAPLNFVKVPEIYFEDPEFIIQEEVTGYTREQIQTNHPEQSCCLAFPSNASIVQSA